MCITNIELAINDSFSKDILSKFCFGIENIKIQNMHIKEGWLVFHRIKINDIKKFTDNLYVDR